MKMQVKLKFWVIVILTNQGRNYFKKFLSHLFCISGAADV